jgi:hypothetical protein
MPQSETPCLRLPLLAASQSQKHVTHNEALAAMDAIIQLSVLTTGATSPPGSPAAGDRHLIGASPTGLFAGHAGQIALFEAEGWRFVAPRTGWIALVAADGMLRYFDGAGWPLVPASLLTTPRLGVNATADATSRLAVASAASLFNHEGAGHQIKINKAAAADTASLLFQTGFSGRAEMGIQSGADFKIKVSANGSDWSDALVADAASGRISFPNAPDLTPPGQNILINGDFQINQRAFAGGALAAGVYGYDRWKGATGGAVVSRSGYAVTLTSGAVSQTIEPDVFGVASFASGAWTISAAALTGGDLTVTFGGATATLSAGAGIRSATLTTGAGDVGSLALKIAVASGAPVLQRLKLEQGARATPWQVRPRPQEQLLCMRYYETSAPAGQNPATYAPGAGNGSIYAISDPGAGSVTVTRLVAPKRATPTVTIRDGAANAGKVSAYNGAWLNNFNITGTLGLSDKGFSLQQNNAGVYNIAFDFTAEAEL